MLKKKVLILLWAQVWAQEKSSLTTVFIAVSARQLFAVRDLL